MDIPGLEDTQMVDGSKTILRSMLGYEFARIASEKENTAIQQRGNSSDIMTLSQHFENKYDDLLMLYIQSLHGTCWSYFCCRQEVPSENLPVNRTEKYEEKCPPRTYKRTERPTVTG